MINLKIHKNANAKTLAAVRAFVCALWVAKLLTSDFAALGYLAEDLFHAHGAMQLLPASVIQFLTDPFSLLAIKAVTILFIVATMFGIGKNRKLIFGSAILLTLYFGIAKGFGGHVNHRELVLLYVTWLLALLPCFDALCLRRDKQSNERNSTPDNSIYVASMQSICGLIVLSYLFVGVARLCVGFPEVFHPDVMYNWVLSRNVRPHPYDSTLGLVMLSSPFGRMLLATALPVSTLVEIMSPVVLWSGKYVRLAFVAMLISFHLGIFLIMNIAFFENIALLLLFLNFTPLLERISREQPAKRMAVAT